MYAYKLPLRSRGLRFFHRSRLTNSTTTYVIFIIIDSSKKTPHNKAIFGRLRQVPIDTIITVYTVEWYIPVLFRSCLTLYHSVSKFIIYNILHEHSSNVQFILENQEEPSTTLGSPSRYLPAKSKMPRDRHNSCNRLLHGYPWNNLSCDFRPAYFQRGYGNQLTTMMKKVLTLLASRTV